MWFSKKILKRLSQTILVVFIYHAIFIYKFLNTYILSYKYVLLILVSAQNFQNATSSLRTKLSTCVIMRLPGLEPGTSTLSVSRSNKLSYNRRWRLGDSNSWPSECKSDALPTKLNPQLKVTVNNKSIYSTVQRECAQEELVSTSKNIQRCPLLSIKGGDPAPLSSRATLLRLSPSHRPHLRRLPPLQVG